VPIEFTCDTCGKLLRTTDARAGARAICPECQQPITVPVANAVSASSFAETGAWETPTIEQDPTSVVGRYAAPQPLVSPSFQPAGGYCSSCGRALIEPAAICPSCGLEPALRASRPQAVAQGTFAGFWRRFAALLLDMMILGAAQGVIASLPRALRFDGIPELLVTWFYFALLESSEYQATVGKMALGLIVTDEHGGRISFARATGRHFAKILSIILAGFGFVMAAFSSRKQALHDMLAGCLVLRKS
jgi:uncharacterized RDD family membrane protein YckC